MIKCSLHFFLQMSKAQIIPTLLQQSLLKPHKNISQQPVIPILKMKPKLILQIDTTTEEQKPAYAEPISRRIGQLVPLKVCDQNRLSKIDDCDDYSQYNVQKHFTFTSQHIHASNNGQSMPQISYNMNSQPSDDSKVSLTQLASSRQKQKSDVQFIFSRNSSIRSALAKENPQSKELVQFLNKTGEEVQRDSDSDSGDFSLFPVTQTTTWLQLQNNLLKKNEELKEMRSCVLEIERKIVFYERDVEARMVELLTVTKAWRKALQEEQ